MQHLLDANFTRCLEIEILFKMRIVHLTPGTANFHCGSCHRDNALIKALRKLGHDATMTPLYLPLVTDGEPASGTTPIFAGGINLFLQQKIPFFRKTPRWLDALLDSKLLLRLAGAKASMTSAKQLGEMTVESLLGMGGRQAKEWQRLITWMKDQEKPEAVSLSNGLLSGLAPAIAEQLNVPVYVSLQGEDSFLDTLPEPYRSKSWELMRQNATHVTRYIATSEWYAQNMRERLAVKPAQVAAVPNGMDFTEYRPRENWPEAKPGNPIIGYLARQIAGKGLGCIVDAFVALCSFESVPRVELYIGGTVTDADLPYIKEQQKKIALAGLTHRVWFLPNLTFEHKIQHLQRLSVLSVPATYGEAFGLYVLEALACGVPVVEPDHAGLGELVRATGGGLLCPPDDSVALAKTLESMLLNPEEAKRLAIHGREQVLTNYTHEAMAKRFLAAIQGT